MRQSKSFTHKVRNFFYGELEEVRRWRNTFNGNNINKGKIVDYLALK